MSEQEIFLLHLLKTCMETIARFSCPERIQPKPSEWYPGVGRLAFVREVTAGLAGYY
jgi:hypothetical protein